MLVIGHFVVFLNTTLAFYELILLQFLVNVQTQLETSTVPSFIAKQLQQTFYNITGFLSAVMTHHFISGSEGGLGGILLIS